MFASTGRFEMNSGSEVAAAAGRSGNNMAGGTAQVEDVEKTALAAGAEFDFVGGVARRPLPPSGYLQRLHFVQGPDLHCPDRTAAAGWMTEASHLGMKGLKIIRKSEIRNQTSLDMINQ